MKTAIIPASLSWCHGSRMGKLLSLVILGCVAKPLWADFAVVVNEELEIGELNQAQIQNIFLAKTDSLPNGEWVFPVDQARGKEVRADFHKLILQRTEAQLTSYFSRLVFTGKGAPPRIVSDDNAVIDLVSKNKSVIGYIEKAAIDNAKGIKVVYVSAD